MSQSEPPREIPEDLLDAYTLGGKVPVLKWYQNNSRATGAGSQRWTPAYIDGLVDKFSTANVKATSHIHCHTYESYPGASGMLCEALDAHDISGMRVAVIGTEIPWIEAICLNHGAASVTTVEYNPPTCDDGRISVLTYEDFTKQRSAYECVVTYSSVEHSGLGRYGDPLAPDGDVEAMAHVRQALVPGGLCLWGAPVGADAVVFNVHRVYGRLRLPLLFAGFVEGEWYGHSKEAMLNRPLDNNSGQPIVALTLAP